MIPIDFMYCQAETLKEAAEVHAQFLAENLSPVYYGGGSEIITMARAGSIAPGAVIDLKRIDECNVLGMDNGNLIIGATNSLSRIKESKYFPLLGSACGRIADHTNQCRITLGGNLCGTIRYRETSLPLMLCDATLILFGTKGKRILPFHKAFDRRLNLEDSEFVSQICIPGWALEAKWVHVKKAAREKIDYPLINVSGLLKDDLLRVAFSGICPFPFRSEEIEHVLNDHKASTEARASAIPQLLPDNAWTNSEASGEYRIFVLKTTIQHLLEDWESSKILQQAE